MEEFLNSIPYNLLITLSTGILVFVVLYKFFPKLFIKIHKPIFFSIGILSLSLGYVGIVVPGLPTTVFILISAWAFSKCSDRFTFWLENHKLFGPMILNWKTYRGLSRRAKTCAFYDCSNICFNYLLRIFFSRRYYFWFIWIRSMSLVSNET